MILLAPDKYKGTLTAAQAAAAMAEGFKPRPYLLAPMADGGEGTAQILASLLGAKESGAYYIAPDGLILVDSSAHIGITTERKANFLCATSAPLGELVRQLLQDHPQSRIIIAIGGTGVCDGGVGFLQALGIEDADSPLIPWYQSRIIGLSDVQVPLLPKEPDSMSALSFAPQKGATLEMMPVLAKRLHEAKDRYSRGLCSPYDGSGGGLGFAIATAIGAKCLPGAKYVLDAYQIPWSQIDLVVTGEGCIDRQTAHGKVVATVAAEAHRHGIPAIAIGGMVKEPAEIEGCKIYSADGLGSPRQRLINKIHTIAADIDPKIAKFS